MNLLLKPDGTMEWMGELPISLSLGPITKRRVSTILPVSRTKRCAFRLLRKVFGDDGRVAVWTRTWTGPWLCTILKTGDSEIFQDRKQAITWEIETLSYLSIQELGDDTCLDRENGYGSIDTSGQE